MQTMKIKRNILGATVEIELTELEIKDAHITYLHDEIEQIFKEHGWIKPKDEIMPKHSEPEPEPETKTDYMSRLTECADKLRRAGISRANTRHCIIEGYERDIYEATRSGMTYSDISAMLHISPTTVYKCIDRVRNAHRAFRFT